MSLIIIEHDAQEDYLSDDFPSDESVRSTCETLAPEKQDDHEEIKGGHECPNCEEITYNPHDNQNHCTAYCARGNPPTTCWGCHQDQPNQLAHMGPGGCLYNAEDHSDSEN